MADYSGALRACRACSDSRKRDYALKQAALTGDPVLNMERARAPAAVSKAVSVPAGTQCTSCNGYHDGIEFKTCNRCLVSRKDKPLLKRIAKDAAKLESRKGKKVCGTKNWCLIADFNQGQSICRPLVDLAWRKIALSRLPSEPPRRSLQTAHSLQKQRQS